MKIWNPILSLFFLLPAFSFALNGTIIDHRVVETTEVDGAKVPGKIQITEEECQALALSRGLKSGEILVMNQDLTEAEMAVQESLTGRRVVSRTVNLCLGK